MALYFFILVFCCFSFVCFSDETQKASFPACCSFPCRNRGICVPTGDIGESYTCDCTRTGYYGKNCEKPFWTTWMREKIRPSKAYMHHILVDWKFKPLWIFVNSFEAVHDIFTRHVYEARRDLIDSPARFDSFHDYATLDAAFNRSLHARVLPPVPKNCPTPLGVVGPEELPPIEKIEKFFLRQRMKLSPSKTNALFPFFAQHFTHQFFRTDYSRGIAYTEAWGHGVDLTHLYGDSLEKQLNLRSLVGGRMKMQSLNGEAWPPYVSDAGVDMWYPAGVPKNKQFALGHKFFSLTPGLLMFNTIWLREHNRVADVLQAAHPSWDDERLFQTTRLIIVVETIRIVIEEYVQHLSNYNLKLKYKPELLFGRPFQYQNKISAEFNLLYRWHSLMPDNFFVDGVNYTLSDIIYRSEMAPRHGMRSFAGAMARTPAGEITHGNNPAPLMMVARAKIRDGRVLRLQSFNNYRRHVGLPPYASFEDLVGPDYPSVSAELKILYGDVEALEFVPGIYLEKRREKTMIPETLVEMGAPASVTGLLANPINSPLFWKPSTFGGNAGFEIAKSATLRKLFCLNMPEATEKACPIDGFALPKDNDISWASKKEGVREFSAVAGAAAVPKSEL